MRILLDPCPESWGHLKALIINILANTVGNWQFGAAFGVATVFPAASHLKLRLHPVMAKRVLWEMLPRDDSAYGGIRGVPGMRVEQQNGRIVLRDLLSQARVLITQPIDPISMMHRLAPTEQPLWLDDGMHLQDEEAKDRASWSAEGKSKRSIAQAASRDWLLSRMLRRPVLVNRTCREHGWANTYTHGDVDLVIEWCCDDTPDALACHLRDSGVTAWPDDPRLGPYREPPRLSGLETLWLGETEVVLRRGYCSGDSPDSALRAAEKLEWYR
jgi:hypothetical protein